ncbi:hypothetical protein HJC23_007781 [Cyclotella cryptica]|uniref:Band 7 domain-containing protein n=1 Tax=Cyclotella cryptica TaxID=29204 RepID=A0ABD3QZT1_9STRA|eukprot:CCRYP_000050-RA/>CCRYP_000050-RA protein AED:0.06 eAED:-0.04 QI:0/0/0/1/1/1/2/0/399
MMTTSTSDLAQLSTKELWHDAIEEANPIATYSWDKGENIADSTAESTAIKIREVRDNPSTAGRKDSCASSVMARCNPVDLWHNRDMSASAVHRRKMWGWTFILALILVAVGLLFASLKKVPSTELGVQYNIHKKQLDDAIKSGGLFVGPPGYRFIKFPSTFITVDLNDRTCVSNDGLLVQFAVTFQYRMTAANVYPAILKYRDHHKWASTVEQAGLSAIHHSCSEFSVTEFQNKRGIIQSTMEKNLRLKLEGNKTAGEEGVNAVAVSLQLTFVHLPEEYNRAVAEKQAAEEDIALAIAQRKQETTKASTELLKAKEESQKIRDTAQNEAEVLLTEAKLKAEEILYSFQKEAEALMQVKNGLNLTTEGVLAYLSTKLLNEADHLTVTTGEPARLSRKDEL